jgi:tRNA(Ile)-lysidine synthase
VESLAGQAGHLREDEDALGAQAAALATRAVSARAGWLGLDRTLLRQAPPALRRRVFQVAAARASGGEVGLTRRHLKALGGLLQGAGTVRLPKGLEARVQGAQLWLGPGERPARAAGPRAPRAEAGAAAAPVPLCPGVWTPWTPLGCRLRVRRVPGGRVPLPGRDRWRAVLSPEVLRAPLAVRGWRPGDRFRPLGLGGCKKLQDFFVDAKVPRAERARIPLVVSGQRIAWVAGHRIAEDFRWPGRGPACIAEVTFPISRRRAWATGWEAS